MIRLENNLLSDDVDWDDILLRRVREGNSTPGLILACAKEQRNIFVGVYRGAGG